jgi:uncharacterized protein (DUF433 family)
MLARKILPPRLRNRKFTTAQASAVLGIPQKQINHLIDDLAPLGLATAGQGERSIEYKGLLALSLAQELTDHVRADLRAPTLRGAVFSGAKYITVPDTSLLVLTKPHRDRVTGGLRALHEAEGDIVTSAQVMQGEPCIKGTRVPAYMIAAIADQRGVSEAVNTYSFLSETQVERAIVYAKAYPRKGRPKSVSLPAKPVTSKKVRVVKRPSGRV